jgi:2-polyprenyl-6-methoxyphenol hydroxylase-like FAD-dependent oxidoreductase
MSTQHEDLLRMLTALAISAGVVISYSCPVTDININPNLSRQKVSVNTLAHVELHADVVIGADGPGSVVRKVVFAKEGAEAEQVGTGMSVFT